MGPALETPARERGSDTEQKLSGKVWVGYYVEQHELPRARAALGKVFQERKAPEGELSRFLAFVGAAPEEWEDATPSRLIVDFKAANEGRWSNADQEPILASTVLARHARIERSESLPFALLVVEFEILVSTNPSARNSEASLSFVIQKCRDQANWILGGPFLGRGEILAVTSKEATLERLQEIRAQVEAADHANGEAREGQLAALEAVSGPPVGLRVSYHGYSHYRIGPNLHAVVGPASESLVRGPGWIGTVYEHTYGIPQNRMGAGAIQFVDVLWSRGQQFHFEPRMTGLLFLLVLWVWVGHKKREVKGLRLRLSKLEEQLGHPILWPRALLSWGPLSKAGAELRVLNHQLGAVSEEYRRSLAETLGELKSEPAVELTVRPRGLRSRNLEGLGIIGRAAEGVMADLDQTAASASTVWGMAKDQMNDYNIRIHRLFGLSVLVFTLLQVALLIANLLRI